MSVDGAGELFSQRSRCADYLRGTATVGCHLALSGHHMTADVELSYEGQYPLDFTSGVTWPPREDYTLAVRRGILEALQERGELTIGGKFTLTRVRVDGLHSCERAFFLAAREAAAAILRILRSHAET